MSVLTQPSDGGPTLADRAVDGRLKLLAAAGCSLGAGMIHAAAAGGHTEHRTLSLLFAACAVAQVAWAMLAVSRPGQNIALAGAALHAGAIAAWAVTRTTSVDFVAGLKTTQDITFQDAMAVGLEVVAVAATLLVLRNPAGRPVRRSAMTPWLAGGVGALALVAAVPAMAAQHGHGSYDQDVAAGATATLAAHGHGNGTDAAAHGHDDSDAAAHDTAAADLAYPASFVEWLDSPELTADQRDAAEALIVDTTEAMKVYPDEAAVQAAGFLSIGDSVTGWEHYVNIDFIADQEVLDPTSPESIVLKVNADGTKKVASAMYILPFGSTMADVPEIAGSLTTWHDHQNLCWEGVQVVAILDANGNCPWGEFRPTAPMLHVWLIDHPCGPFAGIEGSHGTCDSPHDH